MLRRERHVGEHVRLGLVQEGGKLGQLGTQLAALMLSQSCLCLQQLLLANCGRA
jgi:hypothetical protein